MSIILINMIGTVYKIHSDFYYVMPSGKNGDTALVECKLREILKKQLLLSDNFVIKVGILFF